MSARRGSTMLEVLAALAILLLVAAPLIRSGRLALQRSRVARDRMFDSRIMDGLLADLEASRLVAPPAGGTVEVLREERPYRLRTLPALLDGTILIEVACGRVTRRCLLLESREDR